MIYLIPLYTGLFGLGIILFLEWIIFHPEKERNFGVFKLQGVVPSLKPVLAKTLVDVIEKDFLNYDFIKEKFLSNQKITEIRNHLEEKIDDFLQHKVGEKFPIVNMFLTESTKNKVKETLATEIDSALPPLLEKATHGLITGIKLEEHINDFLNKKSNEELEKMFKKKSSSVFMKAKIAVFIIGVIIGSLELLLIHFSS